MFHTLGKVTQAERNSGGYEKKIQEAMLRREREKTLIIVNTTFRLQRPRAAQALRSDQQDSSQKARQKVILGRNKAKE